MMRNWWLSLLVFGSALSLPAQKFQSHWYRPHLLGSAQAASEQMQALSARFIPVSREEHKFYLEEGYSLATATARPSSVQLVFSKGHGRGEAAWETRADDGRPEEAATSKDLFTSIVYREISYLEVWKVPAHLGSSAWCVAPVESLTTRNDVLCLAQLQEAHALVDALATLAKASGSLLVPPLGMWADPGITDDPQRHLRQSGWVVSYLDPEGPPAEAGIRRGDLIYRVNHQPCPGSGSFFSAVRKAAWGDTGAGPNGISVNLDLLRGEKHLSVAVHYPAATAE